MCTHKSNQQKRAVTAALIALIIAQTGCGSTLAAAGPASDPVTRQSFYFDTICQITVYNMENMSEENATNAITEAFSLCNDYEQMLSKTVEGTDVWNINHAGGKAVAVNAETIDLIEMGIAYGDQTDGAFDITIGKAEDLWDFHSDSPSVPDAETLAEAVTHVDYQDIVIDEGASTVQLTDSEAEIDLGGIAKGYIADRVAINLEDHGVTSAIISLGGNIETVGGKPNDNGSQQAFTIGIETPYSDGSQIIGSVQGTDITVVTSGVYERYFEQDGKEYHHILNPETGYPVVTDVLGVSIISSTGHSVDCDALSTTCLILGSDKGKSLIESMDGYEAVFITRDNEIVTTTGLDFTPIK